MRANSKCSSVSMRDSAPTRDTDNAILSRFACGTLPEASAAVIAAFVEIEYRRHGGPCSFSMWSNATTRSQNVSKGAAWSTASRVGMQGNLVWSYTVRNDARLRCPITLSSRVRLLWWGDVTWTSSGARIGTFSNNSAVVWLNTSPARKAGYTPCARTRVAWSRCMRGSFCRKR